MILFVWSCGERFRDFCNDSAVFLMSVKIVLHHNIFLAVKLKSEKMTLENKYLIKFNKLIFSIVGKIFLGLIQGLFLGGGGGGGKIYINFYCLAVN